MTDILKVMVAILIMNLIFTIIFFLTSLIYQSMGHHPSDFLTYLINIQLSCLLIMLTIAAWSRLFKARDHAILRDLYRPITQGLERIGRGDFNIEIENNLELGIVTNELVQSVNRTALDLQQIEEMRQEFISNVSHELQSPLTSIRGFAQALRNEKLNMGDRKHYLTVIENEAIRLSRLTENLLKLSILEARNTKFNPKPYRLDKQIRNLILSCEPQWAGKMLNIDVSLEELNITADADLLSQVWLNLIYNSIKFTPESGSIQIRIHLQDNMIQFEIEDTGIGMSDEQQTRIFERFYKADLSRTRSDDNGSGLGLAIVKKIVELHKGTIAVQSASGIGTCFTVSLPL